jgi:hypothetical protein
MKTLVAACLMGLAVGTLTSATPQPNVAPMVSSAMVRAAVVVDCDNRECASRSTCRDRNNLACLVSYDGTSASCKTEQCKK